MKTIFEYLMSKEKKNVINDFESNRHLAKIYDYVINANLDLNVMEKYEEALAKLYEYSKANIYIKDLFDLFAYIVESSQYKIDNLSGYGRVELKTILFTYDNQKDHVVVLIRNRKLNKLIKIFLNESTFGANLRFGEDNDKHFYAYSWQEGFVIKPSIAYNEDKIDKLAELIRKELFGPYS